MSIAAAPGHRRDPASGRRLAGLLAGVVLLWPLLVWTEFKPWQLVEPRSLKVTLNFLVSFLPPRVDLPFLKLMTAEAWRTVAIATAGLTLAFVIAVPLALLSTARLSVSSLTGRMAPLPLALRQLARALAVILRSVPELVWALLFVRVVGLGPTSGVIAIAITCVVRWMARRWSGRSTPTHG